jgi:phosphoribosylaminoimidazole carboxylase (NCAIR synthetase)
LREAGVPCAQSTSADNFATAHAFAARVGYPLILKPRAGAGAAGTTRVDDDAGLERALRAAHVDRGASIAIEEFIEGHEGFIDTIAIGGQVAHEFISHYYPGVLVAMRERWISPQIVATNRIDAPGYAEVRALTRKVITVLGIGTSATHMEWFFGPKGLKFSEIGCRPPGVGQWDVYAAANDFDIFREWSSAIVHGRTQQSPSRRYACGMIALRPDRDGRIAGYEGADRIWSKFGDWIVASHLPAPGTPTQPVEAGYMANAWIRIRHPDYDQLRSMLDTIGATLRVRAT